MVTILCIYNDHRKAVEAWKDVPGLVILGSPAKRLPVFSMVFKLGNKVCAFLLKFVRVVKQLLLKSAIFKHLFTQSNVERFHEKRSSVSHSFLRQ